MRKTEPKNAVTAMDHALRVLSRRRLSAKELQSRLERRGYKVDEVSDCVDKLESWGYLDDRSLAEDILVSMMEQCPIGKIRAFHELRRRGFSEGLIQDTVEKVYSGESERELACRAVFRYLNGRDQRSLRDKDRARLFRWLQSRGFDHTVVYSVVFPGRGGLE